MYRLARYPRLKEMYSTVFPSAVTAEASAQLNTTHRLRSFSNATRTHLSTAMKPTHLLLTMTFKRSQRSGKQSERQTVRVRTINSSVV